MSRRIADVFFGLVYMLNPATSWAEAPCKSELVCVADELLRHGPSCWEECPCIKKIFRDSRTGARMSDESCKSHKIAVDRYLSTTTTSSGFAAVEFLVSLDRFPRCPNAHTESATVRSPFNIGRPDDLLAELAFWAGSGPYDPLVSQDDEVIPRNLLKVREGASVKASCVSRSLEIEDSSSKYDRNVEACVISPSRNDETLFQFWVAVSETN